MSIIFCSNFQIFHVYLHNTFRLLECGFLIQNKTILNSLKVSIELPQEFIKGCMGINLPENSLNICLSQPPGFESDLLLHCPKHEFLGHSVLC